MLSGSNDNSSVWRFAAAMSAAIALHITALVLAELLSAIPDLDREPRTIPVLLVADRSPESKESTASQQAKAANGSARKLIETKGNSAFQSISGNESENQERAIDKKNVQGKATTDLPELNLPKQSQASRASQARQGLQEIFDRSGDVAEVEQRTTNPDAKLLSAYELELIRILSRDTLYDAYHDVIQDLGVSQLNFQIEMQLLANGAIKRARMAETSGIRIIDELAVRTVYQASPYPKPPASDIQRGYRYTIPITYTIKADK